MARRAGGLLRAWKIFCYTLGSLVALAVALQLWFFAHIAYWSFANPASTAFMNRTLEKPGARVRPGNAHRRNHREPLLGQRPRVAHIDPGGVVQAERALGGGPQAVVGDHQRRRPLPPLRQGQDAPRPQAAEQADRDPPCRKAIRLAPCLQHGVQGRAVRLENPHGLAPALPVGRHRPLERFNGRIVPVPVLRPSGFVA